MEELPNYPSPKVNVSFTKGGGIYPNNKSYGNPKKLKKLDLEILAQKMSLERPILNRE